MQAYLPVSQVVVHALSKQIKPVTGLIESHVTVLAAIPRSILAQLDFLALDPTNFMRNFNHPMKFTKTGVFQAVDRL